MTGREVAIWAGLLGGTGVAAGAFGAHGLRDSVSAVDLDTWRTAAQYQQLHAVALLALGVWLMRRASGLASAAAVAMILGVVVFSGTLYTMVLGGPRWLGAVTPLGGLALMLGWALVAAAGFRSASATAPATSVARGG